MHRDVAVAAVGVPARRAAERRDEVLGAPHERRDVGQRGDVCGGEHAARGLAEGDHLEVLEVDEVGGALALGEHHRAVLRRGERREVVGEVRGRRRVHPHDHALGIERGRDDARAVRRASRRRRPHPRGRGSRRRRARPPSRSGRAGRPGRRAAPGRIGTADASSARLRRRRCAWRSPASRIQTSIVRDAVATTTPSWLRAVCASTTTPWPGRDADSRFDSTTLSPYSVSPMNTGCGNATSPKPRFATSVPCVSWPTDWPTRVDSVKSEFTSRCPNGCAGRPRRVEVERLRVHRQRREQHVVGLGDRAPRTVQVAHALLELLEPESALHDVARRGIRHGEPPSRCPARVR